jgi:DDB1- and CUL4-associated factor 7
MTRDLLATSSDVLRLYDLSKDISSSKPFKLKQEFSLRNEQDFSNPISSFDWNQQDPTKIAVSSIDSTVTILDINQQQLTTQIIAHDNAVFDVTFAPDGWTFASCGSDGSVRVFDTRALQQSSIIYENREKWLIRVSWSNNLGKGNSNLLAMLAQDSADI